MKKHAKKALEHEVELLGRSVSVLVIAGLLIVGGASAALLSSFGTLEGEATVDQAVYLEDSGDDTIGEGETLTAGYEGSFAAPKAYNDEFTAVYNTDTPVKISFERTDEGTVDVGTDPSTGVVQEVIPAAQEFEAGVEEGQADEPIEIEVTPRVDEVEYTLDMPADYNGGDVDLEVSREEGDNYHVKFRHPDDDYSNREWGVKDPSTGSLSTFDSSSSMESDVEEVVSADSTEDGDSGQADTVTLVLEREPGYEQTFGVGAYATSSGALSGDNTRWETEGFSYSDSGTGDHLTPEYNVIGDSVELNEDREYILGTYFPVNTQPETFDFGVTVDMAQ